MSRDSRKLLGDKGEEAAARHLEQSGYRIVARNHRCARGEVDLVAERGDLLVFVEVRTRATSAFGLPSETVNAKKQRRVITAALDWLHTSGGRGRQLRFDVISIVDHPSGAKVEHIPGAFDAGG